MAHPQALPPAAPCRHPAKSWVSSRISLAQTFLIHSRAYYEYGLRAPESLWFGLRRRVNESGSFLITTTPPSNEATLPSSSELVFPHVVNGGGYTTQFVLLSGTAGQSSNGSLRFFKKNGATLSLPFR